MYEVKLEEVDDEQDWEEASDAGSVSSIASDDSGVLIPFDPSQETLAERFYALKDIISPSTRASISDKAAFTASWVKWTAGKAGNAAWIVTTSALMVGLPLMLSIEGEAALVQQEKEYLGQQAAAGGSASLPQGGAPGQASTGVVPPGF